MMERIMLGTIATPSCPVADYMSRFLDSGDAPDIDIDTINVENFETETDANSQKYEKHDITQKTSNKIRLTKEERYGGNNIAIGGFKNMGTIFKRK